MQKKTAKLRWIQDIIILQVIIITILENGSKTKENICLVQGKQLGFLYLTTWKFFVQFT